MIKRLLGLGTCALTLLLPAAPAHAASDELPPAEDNARTTGSHAPPAQACRGQRSPAGSVVLRVLPNGPRRADGTLAFTSGACVYLPPGYATSARRYPTVYLLHGGGGDQGDWMTMGEAPATLDAFYGRDPRNAAIAVSPDGTSGQWYDANDGSLRNEEYVLRWLVPYIDRRFRTIPDRRARAIVGLSNGGYGAMHLAAKAPDLFSMAGAMSGNLGGRSFGGWGDSNEPAYGHGQTPADLAGNLDGVDLTVDWGATCSSDLTVDLCITWGFEQLFRLDNQYFQLQLAAVHHQGASEYRETEGSHAWRWWSMWLRERHLPFFFARLAREMPRDLGAPPAAFRYRSMATEFSVYGYDVRVARDVREFLDLTDVGASGFKVRGSGRAVVTTAPRYRPNAAYDVAGVRTLADRTGRLRVEVDLGPSHTTEQYGTEATALEAAGGYWTDRTITIAAVAAGPVVVASETADELPATGRSAPPTVVALLLVVAGVTRRRFAGR